MANYQPVETQLVAFTTSDSHATFDGGCEGFYFSATADCFVDFNQPTDSGSFLIKADIAYPKFEVSANKIHVKGTGGNGNLHIIGVRG